jgi:hypothetical protein
LFWPAEVDLIQFEFVDQVGSGRNIDKTSSHLVPVVQKLLGQIVADESLYAGDEKLHLASFL